MKDLKRKILIGTSLLSCSAFFFTFQNFSSNGKGFKGHIDSIKQENGTYVVRGWACQYKNNDSLKVRLYAKKNGKYKHVQTAMAANTSGSGVLKVCNSKGKHRFSFVVDESVIRNYSGSTFLIQPQGSTLNIGNSGKFKLPTYVEYLTAKNYMPSKSSIVHEDERVAEGIDFNENNDYDFDRDGVNDNIVCRNEIIKIVSGKTKKAIHQWKRGDNDVNKQRSDCEVVEIKPGYPSIVVGFNNGIFTKTWQMVMLNRGDKGFRNFPIKVNDVSYRNTTRSVECIEMPSRLRSSGYKDGALCFFSGYSNSSDGKSYTALLKLEEENGFLKAYDLTKSSGLPWGGIDGKLWSAFPRTDRKLGSSYRPDGYFTMDSAFLDYNLDGLPDLVVVGQHASIRTARMVLNKAKPQGIQFVTTRITKSGNGYESEFLNAYNLGRNDNSNSTCVYITGESQFIEPGSSATVRDQIRCYNNVTKKWETEYMPGDISTNYKNVKIRENGHGEIVIRTRNEVASGKYTDFQYYTIKHKSRLRGHSDHVKIVGNKVQLYGWGCEVNSSTPMVVEVLTKPITSGDAEFLMSARTNRVAGDTISSLCLHGTESDRKSRFLLTFDKSRLSKDSDNRVFVYIRPSGSKQRKFLRSVQL